MSHDFARSQRLKKESARKPARKKSGGLPSWLWVLVGTLVGCLIMFLVYLSGVAPQLPNLKVAPQPVMPVDKPVVVSQQVTDQPTAPPKRVSPVFEFYTKLPEGGQPVTDIQPLKNDQPPKSDQSLKTDQSAISGQPAVGAVTEKPDPIQQLMAEKEAAKPESVKPEPMKPESMKPVAAKSEIAKNEIAKTEAAKAAAPKPPGNGRYLQAGVFHSKAEMDKLKAHIALLGMKSTVQTTTNAKGEGLQKLLVGPFSSAVEMDDAKIILGGNGVNTIPAK